MDINRFAQKAREAIGSAQTKAVHYGHQQVDRLARRSLLEFSDKSAVEATALRLRSTTDEIIRAERKIAIN
jgi:hypothetical protein